MSVHIDAPAAHRALHDILGTGSDLVARNLGAEDDLHIAGKDPVLPTPFPVASVGAAALAACGLGLSDLWHLRTGRRQTVSVELPAAAASLRSANYLYFKDRDSPDLFDPLFGYYQTGDRRWVQLHTNFAHTRERALAVLGAGPERSDVERATAKWRAPDLEEALAKAGACASFVRTSAEWAAHPHAGAVDQLPLFEIEKIADGAPVPLPAGDRPLAGVRVLDLTRVLAGPTCGRSLAEFGADVLRVSGPHLPFVERCVLDTGHGKLNCHLDLRKPSESASLRKLATSADVFCQAYRPGTLDARGFSPATLTEGHRGLVYMSLSAYGTTGPWANRRGYDTLVQCTTGIAHEQGAGPNGDPEAPPNHLPGSVLDYTTGFLAAYGVLRALYLRATEGGSYSVRLSLCQTARWLKSFDRVPADQHEKVTVPAVDEIAQWMTKSDTAWGQLHHLGPVLGLSETPGRWPRPVSPLGTHPPRWPWATSTPAA